MTLPVARRRRKESRFLRTTIFDDSNLPIFDAIVLVDVFEHMTKPLNFAQATGILAPNGESLIIVTGNGDASACRLDPAQFWYFRIIEHVAMLTQRSAEWISQRLQLHLESWEKVCHYDIPLLTQARQWLQHTAYWQFRRGPRPVRALLRCLPRVRKAERWEVAPGFSASKDHVLAVFRKPMLG